MTRIVSVTGTVLLFLTVYCLSGVTPALAGEKRFNLHRAVIFSLQNNNELKALREELGVREAFKIKAGLYANPTLEIEGATGALTGSPAENSISLSVSQEFLSAGKRGKRMRAADLEMAGFLCRIADRERLLTEELKTALYDLLLAGKRLELAGRSIVLTRQLLEVAKERLAAGDIPELELNLARVEVARSEGRKVEAERDLQPARLKLFSLMGLPMGDEVEFNVPLETKQVTENLAELRLMALITRPDLKALHAEKMKGDAEIALARAERIPDVTIGLAFKRESTAIDLGGSEVRNRDYVVGLKLSVPLPLFDKKQSGIREAEARKGSAEHRYLYLKNNIELEVEASHARLSSAVKIEEIYAGDILPQLGENLKLVQEAYRSGEIGILSVIEEQRKYFEVNDSYLSAIHGRQAAFAKLESAVGASLE